MTVTCVRFRVDSPADRSARLMFPEAPRKRETDLLSRTGPDANIAEFPSEDPGRRDWTRTNDPHHVKVVL